MKLIVLLSAVACLAPATLRAQDALIDPTSFGNAGIGVAIGVAEDSIYVMKLLDGSPAAASRQIHENDRILAVGQGEEPAVLLKGKAVTDCVALIRGEAGTQVRLRVVPQGAPESEAREVMITRDDIQNPLGLALDATLLKRETPAPELVYTPLGEKKQISLAEANVGKVVVVEFWATWCEPCQDAMTAMQKLAEKHAALKDKVTFLTICIDGETETLKGPAVLEKATAHAKQKQWTQTTNGWSSVAGRRNWHIAAVPMIYVVGADGKILAADPKLKELEDILAGLSKS